MRPLGRCEVLLFEIDDPISKIKENT